MLSPAPQETRVVYFVDPSHVRNETWQLSWEGVLPGSDRAVGAPLVVPAAGQTRAYLADSGGAWCGRGVLAGDKLIFRGCSGDSECDQAAGFQCVRDPGAFTDQPQGMCLHIDNKTDTVDFWSQACGLLLRSQRKFRILSAKQGTAVPSGSSTGPRATPPAGSATDLLEVGEIYEPEFAEETHTCSVDDDCKDVTVLALPDNVVRKTSCLADADGKKRCILACDPKSIPKDDPLKQSECGADFECAASAFGDNRCLRAPIGDATFWQTCMPELQSYEVHVGDSFTVSGTSSGYLSNEKEAPDGECILPAQDLSRARLTQWRVPLTATTCKDPVNAHPLSASIDPTTLPSNVCLVDQGAGAATTNLIHFENPIFNIVVQVPLSGPGGKPLVPPDGTSISMGVTGGGNNLNALLGVDVQAQQPRALVVAPDKQTIYVIDEGKSPVATGLRGQLLRLFSSSQSVDTQFIVR